MAINRVPGGDSVLRFLFNVVILILVSTWEQETKSREVFVHLVTFDFQTDLNELTKVIWESLEEMPSVKCSIDLVVYFTNIFMGTITHAFKKR